MSNTVGIERANILISLDFCGNNACFRVAEDFRREHPSTDIVCHETHIGLRGNIIFSASFVRDFDAVILLEEDVWCHPQMLRFAEKALSIIDDKNIDQIALYSPGICQSSGSPFTPMKNGSSFYHSMVPCSSGQIWRREDWFAFQKWLHQANWPKLAKKYASQIPDNVLNWSEHSWKKLYFVYLLENKKFVAYPYTSITTNFSDGGGTHQRRRTFEHQVNMTRLDELDKNSYVDVEDADFIYDSFGEICFQKNLTISDQPLSAIEFNLKGSKTKKFFEHSMKKFVAQSVVSDKQVANVFERFGIDFLPLEANIIHSNHCPDGPIEVVPLKDAVGETKNNGRLIQRSFFYSFPWYLQQIYAWLYIFYRFGKKAAGRK